MNKYILIIIDVILSPVGIYKLLYKSYWGILQILLFYINIVFLTSGIEIYIWIGIFISLVLLWLFYEDFKKILRTNELVKDKYNFVFLTIGLLLTSIMIICLHIFFIYIHLMPVNETKIIL